MFESLNDLVKAQAKFRANMNASGKIAIKAALKEIFENFPQIESIRWTQYAPHFNDGEACVFGVNECDVKLKDREVDPNIESDEEIDEDGWVDSYGLEDAIKDKDLKKIIPKVISEFEEAIQGMDDTMEDTFGDGVRVTATRDSIEVEEYEHD
jgi:hypothetical protein